MCNSSGSLRPLPRAVTAQHCCNPKIGLFWDPHHPQHQSSCSQTPQTQPLSLGAAANAHTFGEENQVSRRLCFPAMANNEGIIPETAPELNTIPRGCWASACCCCAVMFPLELLTLTCMALLSHFPARERWVTYARHTHITGSQNSGVKSRRNGR